MLQPATLIEAAPRDPYNGVPLGVEAIVSIPQGVPETERRHDEAFSDASISLQP